MKRIYIAISAAVFAASCFSASAQELDPTVVVDRAYEGKLMEVHKPYLEMAVPDTVMRFDLDFDYSVFESPYKGSYEFSPYLLSMKPSAALQKEGRFYLKAGAGYQLHPVFDLVWSPSLSGAEDNWRIDVYARHRSFMGNYWTMEGKADYTVDKTDRTWYGHNMQSKAGVNVGYDAGSCVLDLGVAYIGRQQKDIGWSRGYNGVEADFSVMSRRSQSSRLEYGLGASYRFAGDRTIARSDDARLSLNETNFAVNATAGAVFRTHSRLSLDFGLEVDGYSGAVGNAVTMLSLTPRFEYDKGILEADLGIKLSTVIVDTLARGFRKPSRNQVVYPDVKVKIKVIPSALAVVLRAGGGPEIHSYNSLLERNPHLNSLYYDYDRLVGMNYFGQGMGVSIERIMLSAGLEGRIGSRFSWNLRGGYSNCSSGILDAVAVWQTGSSDDVYVGVDYRSYSKTFAVAEWLWKSDSFMADGQVEYTNAFGDAFSESMYCLKPAALTGDVAFEYNFRRRVFAGIDCAFSTERTGGLYSAVIPGYVDLGVSAEYAATRSLSFWARGGNLLGMTIQRYPAYAEKGVYFTAGICLNF